MFFCLIWESKARDQRKSAFFFFFCFCVGCERMICLNCERKRGYHCQGKYHVFCFVLILRERERESSTLLDSVYCIDIFGCIYGHLLYRLDWDYARLYFWVHLWPPFFFFLHIKLNNNDLTTTATITSWPPALLLRISFSRKKRILLSRKISCFLFCPYFEWVREREFYSFGQCLLHRYFWVHLWPLDWWKIIRYF